VAVSLFALNRRTVTRVTFGIIIVFVLAQVAWWLIFQHRYVAQVTETTLAAWQRDAALANAALARSTEADAALFALLAEYPHLRYDPDAEAFAVDAGAVSAFTERQRGLVRMFAFEGPFFVLVVLAGLAIIAANLRLERDLKRRQQNFLAAVTHEFKTPMSTLRLLIETAQMRTLPPEKQRDYLRRMTTELSRLEHTSEQVLAAARLEQSQGVPVLEPHELNSLMQSLIGRARPGLEARGAELSVRYSPEMLPVSLDPDAFGLVVYNLLDNAVKYSPGPRKVVRVGLERQGDLVLVHVEDEGVGIPESERARIFERFYRVGSELTREAQGVGLGLYLVKSITESMHGWVRLGAGEGGGTRFTVVLPRRVVLEEALTPAGATP
jgi:two-component system, OmpR family, sensor histidine kinase SenX3